MKDRIMAMITQEDKRSPYTDEQLAELLKLKREQVTLVRKQAGIADSRERRKPYVLEMLQAVLADNPRISERDLTRKLQSEGFAISRFAIRQYRQELEDKPAALNVVKTIRQKKEIIRETPDPAGSSTKSENKGAFSHIVGFQSSLKPSIEQAKAAVFYPPRGLHTLILGEPGVGKSDLAEAMYHFAREVERVSSAAPFVFFNCADYANNPQLLMAQLFGYVKGAFTGAEMDKEGLVEKADGGILFLDEIHRLPPEGQELLFYLMDKGVFRRFGETQLLRRAAVMIIAATTEDPESSLLITFRRRIPMVIELPPLSARPLSERYELIYEFFRKEARRTQTLIDVSSETVRALLLFDCPGNIGQLLSVIQVSCARGFLNHITDPGRAMQITVEDLPVYARKGLLKIQNRGEVETLISGNLLIYPDDEPVREMPKENLYSLPAEIYRYIEQRYQELQNQGMSDEVINYIIGGELEIRFKKMIKNIGANARPLVRKDLVKIVGLEVFDLAEKMQKIAERKINISGENLFCCLAIHLRTTLDRMADGKDIVNPQLPSIKADYADEFRVAGEMAALVNEAMNITLPEDEIGFIAMYLATFRHNGDSGGDGRIGVVLISHGHVAGGMAEVANRLLGVVHARSVEMSLDESPENALLRAIDTVKDADEGKGVLLLVDMGSLVTFGELITQKTGIKTRVISRVDTVMVIEAVRRAIFHGVTLDELADAIEENPRYISRLAADGNPPQRQKPRALLTVCITGEGSALKVKELIENLIPEAKDQAEIIPFGALGGNLRKVIEDIGRTKEIVAVVGTVNPALDTVPFIPIEDIVTGEGTVRIRALLAGRDPVPAPAPARVPPSPEQEVGLTELLDADLVLLEAEAATREELIERLSRRLLDCGYVREQFAAGVFEREQLEPTFVGNQMAIPHADPGYVLKPGVAIAKLAHPVNWNGHEVRLVFMLALSPTCRSMIQDLYKLIVSKQFLQSLDGVQDGQQLIAAIRAHLQ